MPIKVVDKSTGEYMEYDYKDWTDFAQQYDEISQQIKALERAKDKFKAIIKDEMGDNKFLDMGKGYRFEKQERNYLNYDLAVLRQFLDEDQLSLIVKPDKKKTDEQLNEWKKEGVLEADSIKSIKDRMVAERGTVVAITLVREGKSDFKAQVS